MFPRETSLPHAYYARFMPRFEVEPTAGLGQK